MEESILRAGSAAAATITEVNGKQFVSGLFWQPLSRPRAFMKEAREIGKREGMDIVAIRRGTIMQAGFVAKNQGVVKGMYSMAAALAGVLGRSWIGVFQLTAETYAMVAVHDGAILPGCDLVGPRQAIHEKMVATYSLFPKQWDKVYCPDDFNYGGEELAIDKVLTPNVLQKAYRLKQLTFGMTTRELVITIVVLTLLAGAAVGYFQWRKHKTKLAVAEKIRRDQARQQELARLNASAKKPQAETALDHPWSKLATPEEFARGCTGVVDAMPLVIEGWSFDAATCNGQSAVSTYKRGENATVSQFADAVRKRYRMEPAIFSNGDAALVTVNVKLQSGGDEPLEPADLRLARLTSHLQSVRIKLEINETKISNARVTALPGQEAGTTPVQPSNPWRKFGFSFQTELPPWQTWSGFDGRGVRLTEIKTTIKDLESNPSLIWDTVGELYAQ